MVILLLWIHDCKRDLQLVNYACIPAQHKVLQPAPLFLQDLIN